MSRLGTKSQGSQLPPSGAPTQQPVSGAQLKAKRAGVEGGSNTCGLERQGAKWEILGWGCNGGHLKGTTAPMVDPDNGKSERHEGRVWESCEAPIIFVMPPMQQVVCINAKISFSSRQFEENLRASATRPQSQ